MVQYEKVMKFISTAKEEGATILHGGARPEVKLSLSLWLLLIQLLIGFTFFILFAAFEERLLCSTNYNNRCEDNHANLERGSIRTCSLC